MPKNSSSPAAVFSIGYKGYCLFQQIEKKLLEAVQAVQREHKEAAARVVC